LINSHNGYTNSKGERITPIDVKNNYPAIYKHLMQFEKELIKRTDKGEHFTNLRNCAYLEDFEKEKIIYPCIMAKESNFAFDTNFNFAPAPANIITGNSIKYLLCLLNSKIIYFAMRKYYMGGGIEGELKTNNLLKIPIPLLSEEKQKPFVEIVDKILEMKKENPNADTTDLEKQIDNMVYDLYGLTKEEIEIVEGK